jgi:hypothetical protein
VFEYTSIKHATICECFFRNRKPVGVVRVSSSEGRTTWFVGCNEEGGRRVSARVSSSVEKFSSFVGFVTHERNE